MYFLVFLAIGIFGTPVECQNNKLLRDIVGNVGQLIRKPCEIKMRIYPACNNTLGYEQYCVEDGLRLFNSPLYNKDIKTVLVGIQFLTYADHTEVKNMVQALISQCKFNVILLDNSEHTRTLNYMAAVANIQNDGEVYAKVLNEAIGRGLLSSKHTIGLGFSLGAQIVGNVCRNLQGRCCSLYALDAAGPLYLPNGLSVPFNLLPFETGVSKRDACHVVFLYCNQAFLGTPFLQGHVNVKVNNGVLQTDCIANNVICSHLTCHKLFVEALRSPGSCQAGKCDSTRDFLTGQCKSEPPYQLGLSDVQECDDGCDDDQDVTYYLMETSSNPNRLCNS